MRKSGIRMLLLVALLFSLSVSAYSDRLYDEPSGLEFTESFDFNFIDLELTESFEMVTIENKIDVQGEVTATADSENMIDILSIAFSTQENASVMSLVSYYNYTVYWKKETDFTTNIKRIGVHFLSDVHIRSPDTVNKAA